MPNETMAIPIIEMIERELEAEPPCRRVEDAHAFGQDFRADAITGNDGDAISIHCGCRLFEPGAIGYCFSYRLSALGPTSAP